MNRTTLAETTWTEARQAAPCGVIAAPDAVTAAETVARRFGPRAITLLTAPRVGDDGRTRVPRLSANDCYAALAEASSKTARVALRRFRPQEGVGFAEALGSMFPDPGAYLARAIKSVVADQARQLAREPFAISLDQPVPSRTEGAPLLGDLIEDSARNGRPEQAALDAEDQTSFRHALASALRAVPRHYAEAISRDVARARARAAGSDIGADTDRDRQTLCRARAALAQILRSECGDDNPFIQMLSRQRRSRVRPKSQPSEAWSGARQDALVRKLLETHWTDRAPASGGIVEEAIVNDVTEAASIAPPSPDMRGAMRVLDLFTVDKPTPKSAAAASLYQRARELRKNGDLAAALTHYKACYETEPTFIEALNEVGVMQSQMGNLRDALRVYETIMAMDAAGDHRLIAATNAADIHITWFDAGRNRERNIEMATTYARLAMQKPTPMRACNLILAYVKDRYFMEAKEVLETVVRADSATCQAESLLRTLCQIRDRDLIAWWSWLEESLSEESNP
ncbi:MAG: hypothetical protein NT029_04490 [Armatimonadetes bacterium]|nr:hypothetical protein [Armatimonadota bacterium]